MAAPVTADLLVTASAFALCATGEGRRPELRHPASYLGGMWPAVLIQPSACLMSSGRITLTSAAPKPAARVCRMLWESRVTVCWGVFS